MTVLFSPIFDRRNGDHAGEGEFEMLDRDNLSNWRIDGAVDDFVVVDDGGAALAMADGLIDLQSASFIGPRILSDDELIARAELIASLVQHTHQAIPEELNGIIDTIVIGHPRDRHAFREFAEVSGARMVFLGVKRSQWKAIRRCVDQFGFESAAA